MAYKTITRKLTEEQENLISRLLNWKFGSALNYKEALNNENSLECLKLLNDLWGNTGWGDGKFAEPIYYLIEYIRMIEGYGKAEFYGEDGEEDSENVCKICKSTNMIDISGEEECNKELTEDDYKCLNIDINKEMITRFRACKDCRCVHNIGVVMRN